LTLALQKPRRQVDTDYLNFVRGRPCLVAHCLRRGEPHHVVSRGAGGGDYTAAPLCREHHRQLHTTGLRRFEENFGLELWREVANLLGLYLEDQRRENT